MSTLLLCDDHRVVREALADLLVGLTGVSEVFQAGSAEEVLARYPALAPEAVVMDVRLPGIDGISAVKRIAEAAPEVKTVMFSAYGDKRLLSDAIAAGARARTECTRDWSWARMPATQRRAA